MTSVPLLPIRTERLVLRPYTHADLEASLDYYGDPEVARLLLEPPWTHEVAVEVLRCVDEGDVEAALMHAVTLATRVTDTAPLEATGTGT